MAFFPTPTNGECCEDPCEEMEDACDDCKCDPCSIPSEITELRLGRYEIEYAGPKSTCEKKFFVCKGYETFTPEEDYCFYEGASPPEYSPELKKWVYGQTEQDEDSFCTSGGIGRYFADNGDIKYVGYTGSNPEPVIDDGWKDNTGCDDCETTIKLVCESYTSDDGFTDLPLCSDKSLKKPCNDGPYPKKGAGNSKCCGSGVTTCGSGIQGSGFSSCGLTGSGCCKETNDCGDIPECCDGTEPICSQIKNGCQGSGCQGSGCIGSGIQGSGTQGSGCVPCCVQPEDCDCDNCYDGEPVTKTFCIEEVTTECSSEDITPPTSSC